MTLQQAASPSGLRKCIPILEWGTDYQRDWLRPDIIAGLTTAAVVVPQAMAYATITGLPVEVGVYTVLVLMVVYAVLGIFGDDKLQERRIAALERHASKASIVALAVATAPSRSRAKVVLLMALVAAVGLSGHRTKP